MDQNNQRFSPPSTEIVWPENYSVNGQIFENRLRKLPTSDEMRARRGEVRNQVRNHIGLPNFHINARKIQDLLVSYVTNVAKGMSDRTHLFNSPCRVP